MITYSKISAKGQGALIVDYMKEGRAQADKDVRVEEDPSADRGGRVVSYYTGRDGRGAWMASMGSLIAEHLGVDTSAPPTDAALARLYEAKRADTGEAWAGQGKKRDLSAWDFTASPDKSVSLAAELCGTALERAAIWHAIHLAGEETMRMIMDHVGVARRGDGKTAHAEEGETAYVFYRHHTARPTLEIQDGPDGATAVIEVPVAGDPQSHIHYHLFNAVATQSGHLGSLDSARITKTTSFLFGAYFQAILAERLRELGIEVQVDETHRAIRVNAVPEHARDFFSKRHKDTQIQAAAAAGARGRHASRAFRRGPSEIPQHPAGTAGTIGDSPVSETNSNSSSVPGSQPDSLIDFLQHLKAVNDALPPGQRALSDDLNRLIEASRAPDAAKDEAFRTQALWLIGDWNRNHPSAPLAYVPLDLRMETERRRGTYPGLANEDMKALLRQADLLDDRSLASRVRSQAVTMAGLTPDEQNAARAYKAIGALEARLEDFLQGRGVAAQTRQEEPRPVTPAVQEPASGPEVTTAPVAAQEPSGPSVAQDPVIRDEPASAPEVAPEPKAEQSAGTPAQDVDGPDVAPASGPQPQPAAPTFENRVPAQDEIPPGFDEEYRASLEAETRANREADRAQSAREPAATPQEDEQRRRDDVAHAKEAEDRVPEERNYPSAAGNEQKPGGTVKKDLPTDVPPTPETPVPPEEPTPPTPGTAPHVAPASQPEATAAEAERPRIGLPFPNFGFKLGKPLSERVKEAGKVKEAEKALNLALRQCHVASDGLSESVSALSNRLRPINDEINAFGSENNMSRVAVIAEMKKDGKAAHLRTKLDEAIAADPELAAQYGKVQAAVKNWEVQRKAVQQVAISQGKTLDDDALMHINEKDKKLAGRMQSQPGQQEGKSLFEEIPEQIRKLFEKVKEAIQRVFNRQQAQSQESGMSREV